MNKNIEKSRVVAKRTLKILDLIDEGLTAQEIVARTGANRQLVDYYLNRAKDDTGQI